LLIDAGELLGSHFFGFAFMPHQLQFALGFLEGRSHFLLARGQRLLRVLADFRAQTGLPLSRLG
jgi:hypothetical protein